MLLRREHQPLSMISPHASDDDDGSSTSERQPSPRSALIEARALGAAFLCMVAIGHAQYTWTLFVPSFQRTLQTDAAAVQLGFSCFVAMQTTSVLVLGLLLPSARHERSAMALGALMLFVSLHGLAGARSTARLNLSAALMGVGVGCAYNVCMATSVRTFSRHRGLAAGVVAAGYGAGTLPTIALIEASIESGGADFTYRTLAWALGLAILLAAALLPPPPPSLLLQAAANPATCGKQHSQQLRLAQVLREPSFYLLYVMLVLISAVGLVVTAQLKPMANALGVPEASLVLALEVDRVLNGCSRPVWGLLSDLVGREHALALAFGMQAVVLASWSTVLTSSRSFVVFSALSTFAWGESTRRAQHTHTHTHTHTMHAFLSDAPHGSIALALRQSTASSPPSPLTCTAPTSLGRTTARSTPARPSPASSPARSRRRSPRPTRGRG